MKKIEWKEISKKKIIKYLTIFACVIGAGFFAWNQWNQASIDEIPEVMTVKAVKGNVQSIITGKGTLKPMNEYEVKSLVKGEILKAPFKEGDKVKKGELLYQISTNEMSSTMESAKLGVEKAEKNYENLLEEKQELYIKSDKTGYIKKLHIHKGDMVQVGTVIADIYNGKEMDIQLLFLASEVKKSWLGKNATVFIDSNGEEIAGKVSKIDRIEQVLEGGIITKQITITVQNKGGLREGDMAEAVIENIVSNNSGSFKARTEGSILAKKEGVITTLSMKEGQWIQKGNIIIELSSKELESQLENAKSSIREAKMTLSAQQEQLKSYFIKAPIKGEVITKAKKKGDVIDPSAESTTAMAIIYDLSALRFQMDVDEMDIRNIKVRQKVSISAGAVPNKTFHGIVEQVSMKGTTNNGITTYPVIIKIKKFGDLLPGMNVTGKIIINEAKNVVTVPSTCLQRGNILFVKAVDAEKKDLNSDVPEGFQEKEVSVGINDGINIEIKKGLKEGEEIYIPYDDNNMNDGGFYMEEGYSATEGNMDSENQEGSEIIE